MKEFNVMNFVKYDNEYDELFRAIDNRFPDARFTVSCFDTPDDIKSKILTKDEHIIVKDFYEDENGTTIHDYFVVNKRPDKRFIYYCDVIDELIKNNFIRDDCRYKFLESIKQVYSESRNDKSLKVYGFRWGS